MKITFVLAHADMSGGVRVVADYALRLRDRGHTVTVVTGQGVGRPFRHRVRSWLGGHGWPTSPWRRPSHLDGLPLDVRCLPRGKSLTAGDVPDADVIVGTWWRTMEWIAPLPPEKGVKIHFVQGHEVFDSQPKQRVEAVYRLPVFRIAVSPWLVDVLAEQYGQHDVALAPNGVDTARFNAPPRDRGETPTVGFIYSKSSMKRVDLLIESCRIAAQRVAQLRVISFGASDVAPAMPLPAGATFVCRPQQERIPDLYAAADAWLVGSSSEGFALPVLEALACRTPVIATPVGAAPMLLEDGGGRIVPHDDSRAMAEAIVAMYTMPADRWRAMSEAGRRTAESNDHQQASQRFEAALKQAIARRDFAGAKTD